MGFRPFVYSLATRLGLAGWVGNDADGVFAEVEGPAGQIRDFLAALERDAPPLARVERVSAQPITPDGRAGFAIVASDTSGSRRALVSADSATCADCLRELADPADRRFGYPFINCTNCGPRFTIVRDVPYDRPLTTMAGFTMCAACAAEYHDPADRRFHAQPVCCPACGPRLRLLAGDGTELSGPDGALAGAVAALAAGRVVAVKGLGGYHLAVDAASEHAAALLRARKHREDKPFAVMAARPGRRARPLRSGRPRGAAAGQPPQADRAAAPPQHRPAGDPPAGQRGPGRTRPLATAVAPGNRQLGVMLPYTPLHHLLLRDFGRPMVLTSGNVSDEPIAYRDGDALARLGGIADAFLTHDRPIHIRTDDSVVAPSCGREDVLRRSRGSAPQPLIWPPLSGGHSWPAAPSSRARSVSARRPRLRLPSRRRSRELRDAALVHRGHRALPAAVRRHASRSSRTIFTRTTCPPSTRSISAAASLVGVQHHHAHVAACLAENGTHRPAIGVAFDGLGYGCDGTLWGGEFLLADLAGATRAAHLGPSRCPAARPRSVSPGAWPPPISTPPSAAARLADLAVATRHHLAWPDVPPRPARRQLAAHLEHRSPVRCGRGAAGGSRLRQLRGAGRGGAGAAGRHDAPRPVPRRPSPTGGR